jgi:GNAT superfamily N-acetyltransferase
MSLILPMQMLDLGLVTQDIGDSFFNECELPGSFKLDVWKFNWAQLLTHNFGAMWVGMKSGVPAGFIGGILAPDINNGDIVASETFWYVLPKFRGSTIGVRLVNHFEVWARDMKAARIIMAHLADSMPEALKEFYERRGYRPRETSWIKDLSYEPTISEVSAAS